MEYNYRISIERDPTMKIGNVNISGAAFLAPMAGVTDGIFRRMCKEYGAAFVYTEMVSAKALHYNDKKTAELMKITDAERPCAVQLFGSEPDIIAEAVKKVTDAVRPEIIDVNMGCPAPKIVNNGDGSALMKNPRLAGEIMRAASDAASVPVTAKIRKGWDKDTAVEFAKTLEENGAAAVAVHGRTREEFYGGSADWDTIRAVSAAVKIPVIGNGDIFTAADAKRMLDYTGCAAVMVARGAQGDPFIFTQINELLRTGDVKTVPTDRERVLQAIKHLDALVGEKGEYIGVREARKHIAWYIKGLPSAARVKTRVFCEDSYEGVLRLLSEYMRGL